MIAFLTAMVMILAFCSAWMYAELSTQIIENDKMIDEIYNNDMGHYIEFIDYTNNHNSPVVLIAPDGYVYQNTMNSSEYSNEFIPNVEYYDKQYFIEELRSGARYNVLE